MNRKSPNQTNRIMIRMPSARFSVGDVVQHKLFDYRGVIVDVDTHFQGTEEWYEVVARSRPPSTVLGIRYCHTEPNIKRM